MIPRATVAVNGIAFALLAWLYGGDLSDWTRAQSAEVSAMSQLPSLPFASVLLALALVGGALTAMGVLQKRDGTWKGYRVMPIVAVVGLFVDLFVVSANKIQLSSAARAANTIQVFESRAAERSTPGGVASDGAELQQVLDALGEPPWLVKGQNVTKWNLELQGGCNGPRLERGAAGAGTLFYCVSADRKRAWITAVGLPREERFGAPAVVSAQGQPLVGVVDAPQPPEAPEVPPGEVVPQGPLLFEGDAGNLGPVQ
jgi:hypothetical protein